eukprot:scaffold7052_cov254-Pinguiococcus_pyrenoidosus.AAC.122
MASLKKKSTAMENKHVGFASTASRFVDAAIEAKLKSKDQVRVARPRQLFGAGPHQSDAAGSYCRADASWIPNPWLYGRDPSTSAESQQRLRLEPQALRRAGQSTKRGSRTGPRPGRR